MAGPLTPHSTSPRNLAAAPVLTERQPRSCDRHRASSRCRTWRRRGAGTPGARRRPGHRQYAGDRAAVQEGANAYLTRQFRTLAIFVVVFFLLFLLPADDQRSGSADRSSS